ncbi:SDR family oxidoreductase [Sphingobium lignivorans]|uniref:NAD(P)-dependent dehydrogenase (Short-subunit alcohol dehydrogenase family) n=1 Tax=Sphingobium lignivorans TaxID=2735886 RepID=A0ABR6NFX7_9SPHN|nr:SDR family oxidoreductase [Sphingobium lignivorans]MBB5986188.1 NAD(P)-dependent dehydrogenase (short-subunit alcohol dehydrogenase family) [Sphingobium lignivorans]
MATIVITGANRGIGLELARQYAAAGNIVIRAMRGTDKAEEPIGETLALHVTDPAGIETFAAALEGRAIDLLINNAGISGPARQSATDMDFDGFAQVLDVNVLGPLRVTQALLPNLRKAPAGKIAVVSSLMGSMASPQSGHVAYRASKTAVNKVFQCLAADLSAEGIAVACLHPGWVRTDMGGAGADIDVATSAGGLRAVLDALDVARTGRFWNYDGSELAW